MSDFGFRFYSYDHQPPAPPNGNFGTLIHSLIALTQAPTATGVDTLRALVHSLTLYEPVTQAFAYQRAGETIHLTNTSVLSALARTKNTRIMDALIEHPALFKHAPYVEQVGDRSSDNRQSYATTLIQELFAQGNHVAFSALVNKAHSISTFLRANPQSSNSYQTDTYAYQHSFGRPTATSLLFLEDTSKNHGHLLTLLGSKGWQTDPQGALDCALSLRTMLSEHWKSQYKEGLKYFGPAWRKEQLMRFDQQFLLASANGGFELGISWYQKNYTHLPSAAIEALVHSGYMDLAMGYKKSGLPLIPTPISFPEPGAYEYRDTTPSPHTLAHLAAQSVIHKILQVLPYFLEEWDKDPLAPFSKTPESREVGWSEFVRNNSRALHTLLPIALGQMDYIANSPQEPHVRKHHQALVEKHISKNSYAKKPTATSVPGLPTPPDFLTPLDPLHNLFELTPFEQKTSDDARLVLTSLCRSFYRLHVAQSAHIAKNEPLLYQLPATPATSLEVLVNYLTAPTNNNRLELDALAQFDPTNPAQIAMDAIVGPEQVFTTLTKLFNLYRDRYNNGASTPPKKQAENSPQHLALMERQRQVFYGLYLFSTRYTDEPAARFQLDEKQLAEFEKLTINKHMLPPVNLTHPPALRV